jgi:hypothetical protein
MDSITYIRVINLVLIVSILINVILLIRGEVMNKFLRYMKYTALILNRELQNQKKINDRIKSFPHSKKLS